MWVGFAEFDVLLGDVHSLKEKRSVVRPIVAEIRRRFAVSVAEVDHLDVHRRTGIGVTIAAPDRTHALDVLNAVERFAASRPEVQLLSARTRLVRSDEFE
ncbi:MAG: DUF503 domain-containing protein [Gordonia sp. (in: high G+C Gram-positive bacteria)]